MKRRRARGSRRTPRRSCRRRRASWWPPRGACWLAAATRRSRWRPWRPRPAPTATPCATTSAARRRSSPRSSTRSPTTRASARSRRPRRRQGGDERVHGLVAGDRRLVADRDAFRDFFAILPHVVLDDELRERVAALYEWYRDLYVEGLGDATTVEDERLRRFASLMVAMTDGLAVQKLLDPDGVRARAAVRALGEHVARGPGAGGGLRPRAPVPAWSDRSSPAGGRSRSSPARCSRLIYSAQTVL